MKNILAVTLLVTGLASNVFVYGQMPASPAPVVRSNVPVRSLWQNDSVRIVGPDHMPCVVPDLSKTERMPMMIVRRKWLEPMPNGIKPPRVKVIPVRPPGPLQ
jgi:hypothetical protein